MIRTRVPQPNSVEKAREKCLRKFLHYFPKGYRGQKFQHWERDYKWKAHETWEQQLGKPLFKQLILEKSYPEIVRRALSIESRTNLLFSFEKMALRDAVRAPGNAETFAKELYAWIYGAGNMETKFNSYRDTLASLPVKQTRVVTWPVLTIFGFIADPHKHIYLKPTVTRMAAAKYQFDFEYSSTPEWNVYQSLLAFAKQVATDTKRFEPRDMIDIQSFIWVLGSEEYPD